MTLIWEPYREQRRRWPDTGRHILAQFDAETVVVYQAYRPSTALDAVETGRFGRDFSYSRMSWVKPNFLWMMYRSGWASKENQEHVLALRIPRWFFDRALAEAVESSPGQPGLEDKAAWRAASEASEARLQWDPDHDPYGASVDRRAVQIGLRGGLLQRYGQELLVSVTDVTARVRAEKARLDAEGPDAIQTPRERVYQPEDPAIAERIRLDPAP